MIFSAYQSAKLRDAVAVGMWTLPHDVRRPLILYSNSRRRDLYETMRNHELGEVPGQEVSIKGYDRHKCIFVHIPKCAGISIGRALFGSYDGNHMGIPTYQVIYSKQDFDAYFKFTCVRNPWDRLVSAYNYMTRGSNLVAASARESSTAAANPDLNAAARTKLSTELEVQQFDDFEHFVTSWLSHENVRVHEHFRPQHCFLSSPRGEFKMDFIARFENLHDDLVTIGARLGVEATLDHHNRTAGPRLPYRDYYSPRTRQVVADLYRTDIEVFGYTFDG